MDSYFDLSTSDPPTKSGTYMLRWGIDVAIWFTLLSIQLIVVPLCIISSYIRFITIALTLALTPTLDLTLNV